MGYRVAAADAGRLEDFLSFFDGAAFSDNPDWADCYCLFYHESAEGWEQRTRAQNREGAAAMLRSGEMRGFLAYDGDRPVGWCNANRKERFRRLAGQPELWAQGKAAAGRVLSVVCFVIDPGERRRGLARLLLRTACSAAAAEGLDWVEAYPRKEASTPAQHYHGPLPLYLSEGFAAFRELPDFWIVRKDLRTPAQPR